MGANNEEQSIESSTESASDSGYVFHENTALAPVIKTLASGECYVCCKNRPLKILCHCKTLGRCKECIKNMHDQGQQKCSVCGAFYIYKFKEKRHVKVKELCKFIRDVLITVAIALCTFFVIIGVSYDEASMQILMQFDREQHGIATTIWVLSGLGAFIQIVTALLLLIASIAEDIEGNFMTIKIRLLYLLFLSICQMIGSITASIVYKKFLFNLFTFAFGLVVIEIIAAALLLIACCGGIFYGVFRCFREHFTVPKEELDLSSSE